MKIALDLLCCSKRVVDAVVANIPLGVAATGSKVVPATDANGEEKEKDSNKESASTLADSLPHSRVFVYVPSPTGKALTGDGFHFVFGSVRMKARYLRDKGVSTSAGTTSTRPTSRVAAVLLPHEAPLGHLNSRFFWEVARSSDPTKFYVKAPPDLQIGETFEVSLFGQKIQIRYPKETSSPDPRRRIQKFRICCSPKKKTDGPCQFLQFHLKGGCFCNCTASDGIELSEKETEVSKIPKSNPPSFLVAIPDGTKPGQQFPILVQGQHFLVMCPMKACPRMRVRIVLPMLGCRPDLPPISTDKKATQMFEVRVPHEAKPGGDFCVLALGNRVLITCPKNAGPGQRIRFNLPASCKATGPNNGAPAPSEEEAAVGQWTRAVRAMDLKLQWVPVDNNRVGNPSKRFSMEKSVYLRRLEFQAGDDPKFRRGALSVVPAHVVTMGTKVCSADKRRLLVDYPDISSAQRKSFPDKANWFQDACANLSEAWSEGHIRMNVRREHLLEDSLDAVMSLSPKDLSKIWRFEMIGESGIDDGGFTSGDWYAMISEDILDPDKGLWKPSESDPARMTVNPSSGKQRRFLGLFDPSSLE
jgi:hypothetical protein